MGLWENRCLRSSQISLMESALMILLTISLKQYKEAMKKIMVLHRFQARKFGPELSKGFALDLSMKLTLFLAVSTIIMELTPSVVTLTNERLRNKSQTRIIGMVQEERVGWTFTVAIPESGCPAIDDGKTKDQKLYAENYANIPRVCDALILSET